MKAGLTDALGLPEERQRLMRFCTRLAGGDVDAAEDIAQETLMEAWRRRDALRNPAAWRSYLYGIAQNVYRRRGRVTARERTRVVSYTGTDFYPETHPDLTLPSPEAGLEQAEIATLLDRAMGRLTPNTRRILVAHYVEETPQSELADRFGLTENSVAVRMHRAKEALRNELVRGPLRQEAIAQGLLPRQTDEPPVETRLYCPFCGKGRLCDTSTTGPNGKRRFKMTCTACQFVMGPRQSDFPSDCVFAHHAFDSSEVLGGVTGYKPALHRLLSFFGNYLEDASEKALIPCLGCGGTLQVTDEVPPHLKRPGYTWRGLSVHCPTCSKYHVLLPTAFTLVSPAVRQFWRRYPRIRHQPLQSEPGIRAYRMTIEAVGTSNARIDLLLDKQTFRVTEVR